MNAVISTHRPAISQYAPKVVVLSPPQEKIGEIIGPGGRNIRAIIAKTGADINIDDAGKVTVSGINQAGVDEAVKIIADITREVEIGEVFEGPVRRILPFGAFVELLPGKDGMVHVSKMGPGFIKDPSQVVKLDQIVKVEVIKIDDQGRIDLKLIREPEIKKPVNPEEPLVPME
jgi:polyribonucleotide nucleotidyltransferase